MAPFFLWPVLWVTLPALVWLIDGALRIAGPCAEPALVCAPEVAAAEIGWWFGFGYFLAGLYWIGEAFLVEADRSSPSLMPVAVTLMPAGLALFYARGCGARGAGLEGRRLARAGAGACRYRPSNGCAATCSPASRGTCWATRSPIRSS